MREKSGLVVATLMHRQELLAGCVEVTAVLVDRVGGETSNCAEQAKAFSECGSGSRTSRHSKQRMKLTRPSCGHLCPHTLLSVREREFVSLLDPPALFKDTAAACRNLGTFPVLAGEEGQCDTLLSSPIILYDYPQVAAKSAVQFFDGTEIDEMLALRILPLTDNEKREMGQLDEKTRQLLERTETLPEADLMKLHGAVRRLQPVEVRRR